MSGIHILKFILLFVTTFFFGQMWHLVVLFLIWDRFVFVKKFIRDLPIRAFIETMRFIIINPLFFRTSAMLRYWRNLRYLAFDLNKIIWVVVMCIVVPFCYKWTLFSISLILQKWGPEFCLVFILCAKLSSFLSGCLNKLR